jgi:hypothetical protein
MLVCSAVQLLMIRRYIWLSIVVGDLRLVAQIIEGTGMNHDLIVLL